MFKQKEIVDQAQVQPSNFHDNEEQDHPTGTHEEGTPQELIPQVRRSTI